MVNEESADSILNDIHRLQKIFVTDFDLTRTKEGWAFKCSYTFSNHSSGLQTSAVVSIPTYVAGTTIVGKSLEEILRQVEPLERESN